MDPKSVKACVGNDAKLAPSGTYRDEESGVCQSGPRSHVLSLELGLVAYGTVDVDRISCIIEAGVISVAHVVPP